MTLAHAHGNFNITRSGCLLKYLHIFVKKVICRSKRSSPMKVARDKQIPTTNLMADPVVDHDATLCDISYDSETELLYY